MSGPGRDTPPPSEAGDTRTPSWQLVVLALLVVGALAVRLAGITATYPYLHYVDEAHLVGRAASLQARQSLNPQWFTWPPSLLYLHVLAHQTYLFFAGEMIQPLTCPPMVELYEHRPHLLPYYNIVCPSQLLIVSRVFTALLGSLCLVPAFFLGRRLAGAGAGLSAALLLGVLPGHIEYSRNPSGDIPMTLAFLITLLASIHLLSRRRSADLVWAGVATALATACKYTMGLGLLVPICALLWRAVARDGRAALRERQVWREVVVVCGIAGITFFAVNPHWLIHPTVAIEALLKEVTYYHQDAYEDAPTNPWQWALFFIDPAHAGWLFVGLAALGCAALRGPRARPLLVAVPFLVVYLLPLATAPTQPWRNLLPAAAWFVVLGAVGLAAAATVLARTIRSPVAAWSLALLAAAGAFVPNGRAIAATVAVRSLGPNSRTEMVLWLASQAPLAGEVVFDAHLQVHPEEMAWLQDRGLRVRVSHAPVPNGRGPRCYITAPYPENLPAKERPDLHRAVLAGQTPVVSFGTAGLEYYYDRWILPRVRIEAYDLEGGCSTARPPWLGETSPY